MSVCVGSDPLLSIIACYCSPNPLRGSVDIILYLPIDKKSGNKVPYGRSQVMM